jgi:hypothetical protein
MENKYKKVGIYLLSSFTLGYGLFASSILWFNQDVSYASSVAGYIWTFLQTLFFLNIAAAWIILNRAMFKKKTILAHLFSILVYIYCLMIGGVFAGVGM